MSTVIFCSSEHCPQQTVARELEQSGMDVIRIDALPLGHDADAIAQLFLTASENIGHPVGYVGSASAGAGALLAAVQRPDRVAAVVSINGRTDLAMDVFRAVQTPVLLLVNDMPVLRMNREAVSLMRCERRIEIVHGDGEAARRAIAEKTERWLSERLASFSVPV